MRRPARPPLYPYTPFSGPGVAGEPRDEPRRARELARGDVAAQADRLAARVQQHHDLLERRVAGPLADAVDRALHLPDRKSTRLNSSHSQISYAVFCLKKKH